MQEGTEMRQIFPSNFSDSPTVSGASCVVRQGEFFLFGGYNGKKREDSLWKLTNISEQKSVFFF